MNILNPICLRQKPEELSPACGLRDVGPLSFGETRKIPPWVDDGGIVTRGWSKKAKAEALSSK